MDKPASSVANPPVSEAHLRSILATVPDAMIVIDEKGVILSFSAAAETTFGFPKRKSLGRTSRC